MFRLPELVGKSAVFTGQSSGTAGQYGIVDVEPVGAMLSQIRGFCMTLYALAWEKQKSGCRRPRHHEAPRVLIA